MGTLSTVLIALWVSISVVWWCWRALEHEERRVRIHWPMVNTISSLCVAGYASWWLAPSLPFEYQYRDIWMSINYKLEGDTREYETIRVTPSKSFFITGKLNGKGPVKSYRVYPSGKWEEVK